MFLPDLDQLKLTGVFGTSDGHGTKQPGKHPDDPNLDTTTPQQRTTNAAHAFTFERGNAAHSIRDGQSSLLIPEALKYVDSTTFIVYRNGMAQEIGIDYRLDFESNQILLRHPIQSTDDYIEIRFTRFDRTILKDVLLLPRMNFTDADLKDLIPQPWDEFNLDRLTKYNPDFTRVNTTIFKGVATTCRITEHGIIGDLHMVQLK